MTREIRVGVKRGPKESSEETRKSRSQPSYMIDWPVFCDGGEGGLLVGTRTDT